MTTYILNREVLGVYTYFILSYFNPVSQVFPKVTTRHHRVHPDASLSITSHHLWWGYTELSPPAPA